MKLPTFDASGAKLRTIFALAIVLAQFGDVAHAGEVNLGPGLSPEVVEQFATPYTEVSVREDVNVVRLFFLPSCPYCRLAHSTVVRWGETLPKAIRFETTPVVTRDRAAMLSAAAYYAAAAMNPAAAGRYVDALYAELQDRHAPAGDVATYLSVAKATGYEPRRFYAAMASDESKKKVRKAGLLASTYKLTSTPSVTMGGRFVVTPESSQGVNSAFYDLLNAVMSKYLIETGGMR